jgi:hypothetical protein
MWSTHKKLFLRLMVVGATLVSAVFVIVLGRIHKLTPPVTRASTSQLTIARGPIQNIRFTLYDAGIYPQQIKLKPGNVAVEIVDRTHVSLGLNIEHETLGARVIVGQVSFLNRLGGRGVFRLDAGNYIVSDVSRAANQAQIVVEP